MEKLKVGIIGAGRIGLIHAKNILNSHLMDLEAIADINLENIKKNNLEKRVPIVTDNPNDLFNHPNINAIFICSSTDTHTDFIKKAALAKKHIFCEKPISLDIRETEEALQYAHEANVKLQVGFNRRFDQHFRKVRSIIKEGKIGKVHLIKVSSRDPEPPNEEYIKKSGGIFIDMTIHDFDMVRYLAGCDVEEISVKAANLIDPVFAKYNDADTAVITMKLKNGAIAVIDNSRQAVYGYDQRIEVFGEKGNVSADNVRQTSVQLSTKNSINIDHPKYFFADRYKDSFIDQINEFALSILKDIPIECTGDDGYKAQQLAIAAKKSWQENRSVSISELNKVNL